MDLLDILLQGASGGGALNLPDILRQLQRKQEQEQRAQQQTQLLETKARLQAADPLRQAQVAKTQASVAPQKSIEQILGGDESQQGSSIFAYGGGDPTTMEGSNDRIRLILDALMAGEAPPGQDPNIGIQAQQDLTPINPQPGQTFGLKGYQDEGFGFNPQTGAFTNIGIPSGPSSTIKSRPTDQMTPADVAKMAEIATALDKAKVPSDIKSMVLQQSFPQYKAQQEKEKQTLRKETKQDQADIQRRNLREKFVMENQSNLFKRGTGESFLGQGKPPEDTEQILKDYAVLKPENAKDMRQLDMVGGYVDGFKDLLVKIKPLLSSQTKGIPGRIGAGTGIAYLRAQGDARIREMDAKAAQITLLARGFGGDSRVSDPEMKRLDNAMITGWVTKEGADATIGVLDDFIKNRSSSLGFNQYKTMGQRPKQEQALEQQNILRNKDKKGRPIISKDNGLNWEYE